MKQYPKKYEDYLTSERSLKWCKLDKIGTDIGLDYKEYASKMRETVDELQMMSYEYTLKIVWLMKRFHYRGKPRNRIQNNGIILDRAFGVFMRTQVGRDNKLIRNIAPFTPIISYIYDFYPDFDVIDPFKTKLKYPYKYMSLECLFLVNRMPERLELLKYGEDQIMSYAQFTDYILNYISCYNEDVNYRHYIYEQNNFKHSPYVKINWDKRLKI